MRAPLALACLLLFFGCSDSSPDAPEPEPKTIVVRSDGSGDQPNIQAAIDAASNGDEIVLADTLFTGDGNRDLDFHGKEIVIRSQSDDPWKCTIDCEGTVAEPHRAFRFHTRENRKSIVRGITIKNGYTPDAGGAVRCERKTSPLFKNVIFRSNASMAVFVTAASPLFDLCLFWDNPAGAVTCSDSSTVKFTGSNFANNQLQGSGAAMAVLNSAAEIVSCRIGDNMATVGGGAIFAAGNSDVRAKLTLTGCDFAWNSAGSHGGALHTVRTDLNMDRCEFLSNSAVAAGGAIYLDSETRGTIANSLFTRSNQDAEGAALTWGFQSTLAVENSIVVNGLTPVTCNAVGASPRFICSDIYPADAWTGCIEDQLTQDGNFSADPRFCDSALADFTVTADSPCAPTGPCGQVGPNGVGCETPFLVKQRRR